MTKETVVFVHGENEVDMVKDEIQDLLSLGIISKGEILSSQTCDFVNWSTIVELHWSTVPIHNWKHFDAPETPMFYKKKGVA